VKIAFWSNIHGQTGTTSNLLAIAVMCTLQYQFKNIVTQTHFNLNNLEAPLVSLSSSIAKEYLIDFGIDALARSIKSAPLNGEIIDNSCISLMNKKLNLLPGTIKNNRDIYESDMSKTVTSILNIAARYYDIVYIDTNSGRNDLTMKILQNVDLIIVNLSQNKSIMDDYATNYHFNQEKVFYLIGNYDSNSKYNIRNMQKVYHWLKDKNTAVIPYNTEYMDSQSDGQVIPFLIKNITCGKEDSNRYFIHEVNTAVTKIMKIVGLEGQKNRKSE
jgi:cellulose biosynthesis protein BcsQ